MESFDTEVKKNPLSEEDEAGEAPPLLSLAGIKYYLASMGDTAYLLIAVTLAIGLGVTVNLIFGGKRMNKYTSEWIHKLIALFGKVWINALKLVVLPLIASNMTTAVVSIKQVKGAKDLALRTFAYYLTTTLLAATIGLVLAVTLLIPNVDKNLDISELDIEKDFSKDDVAKRDVVGQVEAILLGLVPSNIVASMAIGNLLGVITFFLAVGILIEHTDKKPSPIYTLFQEVNKISFTVVQKLVWFTPFGVFSLLYPTLAMQKDLGKLVTSVLILICSLALGILVHCTVIYPSLFFLATRQNPIPYMQNASPACLTAFSTSSSAATLPVTIKCAVDNNNISGAVANFVLSLGATVNMDGTAIGFPLSVIFLATSQDEDLSASRIVMIVLVATLASMGAAPVPSAGLVLLIMIMDTVDVTVTSLFSVIIAIDWLNDRIETMTNVLGDSLAAGIIQNYYSQLLMKGNGAEVKRASVLITGQVDDTFKKDSEKLMKRRTSTMSVKDQMAISSATGLDVSTVEEEEDTAAMDDPDALNVSNPAHQANPIYDGVDMDV